MTACVRGCTIFKRHLSACPAKDYETGAWVVADLAPHEREALFDADLHLRFPDHRKGLYIDAGGGIEEWFACNGCKPRVARHGQVCEQCHFRLTEWLGTENSLAWAYGWLAQDLAPGQSGAARQDWQRGGEGSPPAALALHVHDLRQDIAQLLGGRLSTLCTVHNLVGPDWFRQRINAARNQVRVAGDNGSIGEADWHAWMPQNQQEVNSAAKYLATWLGRIETDPDFVCSVYDDAELLMVRTASIAPWRAKPKRLPSIPCPECEHEALAIYDGDDRVTCRRCRVTIPRQRFEIWSEMFLYEKRNAAS